MSMVLSLPPLKAQDNVYKPQVSKVSKSDMGKGQEVSTQNAVQIRHIR